MVAKVSRSDGSTCESHRLASLSPSLLCLASPVRLLLERRVVSGWRGELIDSVARRHWSEAGHSRSLLPSIALFLSMCFAVLLCPLLVLFASVVLLLISVTRASVCRLLQHVLHPDWCA